MNTIKYTNEKSFFFYEYDIHSKKWKILRKINNIQRNLDDKHSAVQEGI